ncbi:MAG: DNA alkylation response protein [Betaproteobacteria bacterium]|nr:DNA alkylation response protein [Betaproteobacteria bacterium]
MIHPAALEQLSEIEPQRPSNDAVDFGRTAALPRFEPLTEQGSINRFELDKQLQSLMRVYLDPSLCDAIWPAMQHMGALAGGALDSLAHEADQHPPSLSHRDRNGSNIQRIHKHPAYRDLERIAFGQFGLAAMNHRPGILGADAPWPPVAKYLLSYLFVQSEFGLCCPLSMTDSLSRTLARFGPADLIAHYLPLLTSTDIDQLAQGAMFMTEQGAGSDVARTASIALAEPYPHALSNASDPNQISEPTWRLYGEKWFCSNPDAALAMVLARTGPMDLGIKAVSLFLMPKTLPNGQANHYRIVRLKDKLGSRSMASGEISLEGAKAWLIGEAGQEHKEAENPAFGMAYGLTRILTPLIKFRACRDARKVSGDAMEVRGGCGYIEAWPDARLLRDAHLGSIWEGTSNIVALDVMRAIQRDQGLEALQAHCDRLSDDIKAQVRFPRLQESYVQWQSAQARLKDMVHAAAFQGRDDLARKAASGLYHSATSLFMLWEVSQMPEGKAADFRCAAASAVIAHRLLGSNPLSIDPLSDTDSHLFR